MPARTIRYRGTRRYRSGHGFGRYHGNYRVGRYSRSGYRTATFVTLPECHCVCGDGESGTDPATLRFSQEMKMWIQLENSEVSFTTGDTVTGKIFCSFDEAFATKTLTLTLMVDEEIEKFDDSKLIFDWKEESIFKRTWKVWTLPDELQIAGRDPMIVPGQYCFPFSFQLPANLPPSIFTNDGKSQLDYKIRAQFVPHKENEWITKNVESILRSKDLYLHISRPVDPIVINPAL